LVWKLSDAGEAKFNSLHRHDSEFVSPVKSIFSFLSAKEKPRQRFYLLPGQSGRAYRRKQRFILKCSIAVGLVVSAIFTLVLYLKYRSPK